MYSRRNLTISIPLTAMLLVATVLTGCDSNGGGTSDGTLTFEGRVTNQAGLGKRADIEGAVVTAADLEAGGSLTTLPGEATTDAEGNFRLAVDGASNIVVLAADKTDFHSEVLVVHEGGGTVRTVPMTTESEAEAAVYVAAVPTAADVVTAADVAAYVNMDLAVEWKAGGTTSAQIVAALEASSRAESEYFNRDDAAEINANRARQEKHDSFLTLEADLNAAATASAQAAAISSFEQALIAAYSKAGASLEAQAKARQTGRTALIKFFSQGSAKARFALRQQAEILTSLATALAVEAAFKSEGAAQERLNALVEFRAGLIDALRAASSDGEIAGARDNYQAKVESEIMAELGIDAALLATVRTVLTPAEATLDASIASAGSASAVASAYTTFYTTAEASARTTLVTSSNADFGANVLTLLRTQ